MSAPPIGMMIRKPRPSDSNAISQNSTWLPPEATNEITSSSSTIASPRFSQCWPWKVIGAPLISACNFANAIRLPEKVTAPIARPTDISTRLWVWIAPGMPMLNASGAFSAAAATKTAAKTDERVERRDQLRQRRHLDAQRNRDTDPAADQDAEQDQQICPAAEAVVQQCRDHGDGHADHAEAVALSRRDRR